MDSAEKLVEKYLKCCGFKKVVYEPDGNVPPDFLADGRVAVEVRRLNQNVRDGQKTRGLQEASIPLRNHVKALAESFGAPKGFSYLVFMRFSRPIDDWRKIRTTLKNELTTVVQNPLRSRKKIKIKAGNVELEVRLASKPMRTLFILIGQSDEQSGGVHPV